MTRTLARAAALLSLAAAAEAGNSGFRLTYPLTFTTGMSNNNLVSLPYFYYPSGDVRHAAQNSLDLCRDLNGGVPTVKVASLVRYVTSRDIPTSQACASSIKVFDLIPGESYSIKPVGRGVTIDIVGSHDDAYAPNKTNVPELKLYPLFFDPGRTNNNWFSVPYHARAQNSVDACRELNRLTSSKIAQLTRFVTTLDTPRTQSCLSAIKAFDLVPGEGLIVKPSAAGAAIGLEVY